MNFPKFSNPMQPRAGEQQSS